MAQFNQHDFLKRLKSETEAILSFAETLDHLTPDALTEHPGPGQWNVIECLDHMNAATELYLNQIEPKMKTHLKETRQPVFKRGFIAAFSTKSLKPTDSGEIRNKMKTLKVFQPGSGKNVGAIIERFKKNQLRILKILNELEGKDLRSFKITTALGKILKFYVGEALEFAIAHNQRHVLQAQKALKQ